MDGVSIAKSQVQLIKFIHIYLCLPTFTILAIPVKLNVFCLSFYFRHTDPVSPHYSEKVGVRFYAKNLEFYQLPY